MGFSRSVRRNLLDHLLGKSAYSPPSTFYIGVSLTLPTSGGSNITEPTDSAYERQSTNAVDWDNATDTDPALSISNTDILFAQATEDWFSGAVIPYVVIFDSLSGGNFIGFGYYARAKSVYADDILTLEAGKVQLGLL